MAPIKRKILQQKKGYNMWWIITILSLIGVALNIKKKSACFIVWIFTNSAWFFHNFTTDKDYPQATIYAAYFFLSIWGLIEWRRKKEKG